MIGDRPLLVGGDSTIHAGWKTHLAKVARLAGFTGKTVTRTKDKARSPKQRKISDTCTSNTCWRNTQKWL